MFRVTGLKLHNICQLLDFDTELSGGLNAVVGPNGRGKTTLLRALCYALTGVTDAAWGRQQALQADGMADPGFAEARFTDGQETWRIRRYSAASVKFPDLLLRGTEEIARRRQSVDAAMEQVFGMPCRLMFQVCWSRQGELSQLLTAPSAAISDFLAQVFDLSRLEKLREALKVQLDTVPLIAAPQPSSAELEASLASRDGDLAAEAEIPAAERLVELAEESLSKAQAAVAASSSAVAAWSAHRSLEAFRDALERASADLPDPGSDPGVVPGTAGELSAWVAAARDACTRDLGVREELSRQLDYRRRELSSAESSLKASSARREDYERSLSDIRARISGALSSAVCPTCGSAVPESGRKAYEAGVYSSLTGRTKAAFEKLSAADLDRMRSEEESLKARLGGMSSEIAGLEASLKQQEAACAASESDLGVRTHAALKRVRELVVASEAMLPEMPSPELERRMSAARQEVADRRRELQALRDRVTAARAWRDAQRQALESAKAAESRARVNTAVRDALSQLRDVFSRNRVQARYMRSRIDGLNCRLGRYMALTGLPFVLRLDPDTRSFCYVTQDGYEHPSAHLSGAQKAMCSVALQMALLEVMGPSMNLYLMDEPTEALDEANKLVMADMFARMNTLLPDTDGVMLIVTRDRAVIESCARVVELE